MTNYQEDERLKNWITVLQGPNSEMSKIAADKLGEIKRKDATPFLIEQMKKRSSVVASACALALGEINDKSAAPALIDVMKSHQDVPVQTAAAQALGQLKSVTAIPALQWMLNNYLETYRHDRFNLTRGMSRGLFTAVIDALRTIGTPVAIRIANDAERADRV